MLKTLKYTAAGLAISVMVAGGASAATYSFSSGSASAMPSVNGSPVAMSNAQATASGFARLLFGANGNAGAGWIRNGRSSQMTGFRAAFGSIFGGSRFGYFGVGRYVPSGNRVANVSAVPLPATGLLMVGAIGGMAAMRSRKKKPATTA